MIKPPTLLKGSCKISLVHLSVCLFVSDAFFSESAQWIFLVLCMRVFRSIYYKVTKPDFVILFLLSR